MTDAQGNNFMEDRLIFIARIEEVFPHGVDLPCGDRIDIILQRLRLKFGNDGFKHVRVIVDQGEKWAYLTPTLLDTIPDGFIRIYFRSEEEAVMAKLEL
jgi:hypothetical protein